MKRVSASSHAHSRGLRGRSSKRGRGVSSGITRHDPAKADGPSSLPASRVLAGESGLVLSYSRALFLRDLEKLRHLQRQILGDTQAAYELEASADADLRAPNAPLASAEEETNRSNANDARRDTNSDLLKAIRNAPVPLSTLLRLDFSSSGSRIPQTPSVLGSNQESSVIVDKELSVSHPDQEPESGHSEPTMLFDAPNASLVPAIYEKEGNGHHSFEDSGASLPDLAPRGGNIPSWNCSASLQPTGSLLDRTANLLSVSSPFEGGPSDALPFSAKGQQMTPPDTSNLDDNIPSTSDVWKSSTEQQAAIGLPTTVVEQLLSSNVVKLDRSEILHVQPDGKAGEDYRQPPSDVFSKVRQRKGMEQLKAKTPDWSSGRRVDTFGRSSTVSRAPFAGDQRPASQFSGFSSERRILHRGSSDGRQDASKMSTSAQPRRNAPSSEHSKSVTENIAGSRQHPIRGGTPRTYEVWEPNNASFNTSYVTRSHTETPTSATLDTSHGDDHPRSYSPHVGTHYAAPQDPPYQVPDRPYDQYYQRDPFASQQEARFVSPLAYTAPVDERGGAYYEGRSGESQYSARGYADNPYDLAPNPAVFHAHTTRDVLYRSSRTAQMDDIDRDSGGSADYRSRWRQYRPPNSAFSTVRQHDDFTDYTPLDRRQPELPYH